MHTRISEDLDEALRGAAEDLRVPVSNLVRNVLEEALDVVESVTESMGGLVDDVVDEAQELGERFRQSWREHEERARRGQGRGRHRDPSRDPAPESSRPVPDFPEVVGWQALLLNGRQTCAGCGRALTRGDRALLGVSTSGRPCAYLCEPCGDTIR